jgi:hypothetical protein
MKFKLWCFIAAMIFEITASNAAAIRSGHEEYCYHYTVGYNAEIRENKIYDIVDRKFPNGKCLIELSNDIRLKVKLVKGSIAHGTIKYVDGSSYIGEFENGKKHGAGVHTFANGESRDGKWENNKFVYGTIWYPDGSSYIGALEDGRKHGFGKYIFASGESHDGKWENNKLVYGTIKHSNGGIYSFHFFPIFFHGT